jgi:hypothetical protein
LERAARYLVRSCFPLRRTGTANLPLHGGKPPPWLFERMVRLSRVILAHMARECEPEEERAV